MRKSFLKCKINVLCTSKGIYFNNLNTSVGIPVPEHVNIFPVPPHCAPFMWVIFGLQIFVCLWIYLILAIKLLAIYLHNLAFAFSHDVYNNFFLNSTTAAFVKKSSKKQTCHVVKNQKKKIKYLKNIRSCFLLLLVYMLEELQLCF